MPTDTPDIIREWARTIPRGSSILNLGSDERVPIARVLTDEGFTMYGVDAPAIEDSEFFNRTFDGVIALGVMSGLPPPMQSIVIGKVARALRRGGKFLFTAPQHAAREYQRVLRDQGMLMVGEQSDDEHTYYFAVKG